MQFVTQLLLFLLSAPKGTKEIGVKQWFLTSGLRIIFVLIGYFVVIFVVKLLTKKFVHIVEDEDRSTRSEREKRADTISGIVNTTTRIFLGLICFFMILREFNVNIAPLLTGAGIVGIAIGFGAQSVIKDFLSGFFLLAEDQLRIGDVVKIGEHSGTVENITLRTTRLRNLDGNVHIIPNGEIKTVVNMTNKWSRAVVDIDIAYKEDIDRVMVIIETVALKLQNEEKYKKLILEKPQVLGVQKLGGSGITIRLIVKTIPSKQWGITRELRKRIKSAFDRVGIEIPFPQLVIHGASAQKKGAQTSL